MTLHISKIKARKNATDSIESNSACFELFRLIEATLYNNAVNRMLEKLTDYKLRFNNASDTSFRFLLKLMFSF